MSNVKEIDVELLDATNKLFRLLSEDEIKDIMNSNNTPTLMVVNDKKYIVIDGDKTKVVIGKDYNYIFNKVNGDFKRWGKDYEDDPTYSPIGGEILDIEVTTICRGIIINGNKRQLCPYCYKSNTPNGKNMSFDTFKTIMDKMGKQLTQIAFGADSEATSNPDLFKMADYCRSIGVVPNITVANVSDEIADKLVNVMGAVAVSRYSDKNVCYDSIKKLTDRGMTQCNMHFMISEETYDACMETLSDIKSDDRLSKLNAIVLLSLKKKGRGVGYNKLSSEKYNNIVKYCMDNDIRFGMDSCGAKKFLDSVKDHPNYENFKIVCEPCESTAFSQYIDVDAKYFPCSFCEGADDWDEGIDVVKCDNFLEDIWYNDRVKKFRHKLTNNCNNCHKARECPIYDV